MQEHDNDLDIIVNDLYNQVPILTIKQLKYSDLITYMKGIQNIFYDKTTLTDIVLLNYIVVMMSRQKTKLKKEENYIGLA